MTTLAQISETQAQKATTANENFTAVSPAGLFGRKALTTSGLTWGFFGGILYVDGVATTIADGTVALTANQTNYIEATRAGVVSKNITGFTAGRIPLYTAVTGASTISSYTDYRGVHSPLIGAAIVDLSGSPQTVQVSAAQARAAVIRVAGSLVGAWRIEFPAIRGAWVIVNEATGSGQLTVASVASGSPTPATITLNAGEHAVVACDGENIRKIAMGGAMSGASLSLTGLLDISAAGAGQIKFPATQNASADGNTLDDYEEGTWTPVDSSGAGLSLTVGNAIYVKIGKLVWAQCYVIYPATADGSAAIIGGLPFAGSGQGYSTGAVNSGSAVANIIARVGSLVTTVDIFTTAGATVSNAQLTTQYVVWAITYQT